MRRRRSHGLRRLHRGGGRPRLSGSRCLCRAWLLLRRVRRAAAGGVIAARPADARLMPNGQIMRQPGADRRFVTPELQIGISYTYVFTAEIIRNDQPITETIEVEVMAGAESRVTFGKLIASIPAEPTRIASK